jgi:PmbA protein
MTPEETANYLKNKLMQKGADDVIVTSGKDTTTLIKFANNKISVTKSWSTVNVGVFLTQDKKIVSTSIKDFSQKTANDTITSLMKFIKSAKPNTEYEGIAQGPFKYKQIKECFDKNIIDMHDKAVDAVEAGVNKALSIGAKRTAGTLEFSHDEFYLTTSNNVEAHDKGTSIYYSIRALVDKYASGHMVNVSRVLNKFKPEATAAEAAEIAVQAVDPQECTEGSYDVLFHPFAFSNLLMNLGGNFSVFYIESGLSCLQNTLNKKVMNEKVTIYDDGTLKNGFGTGLFDSEGVPTQKTLLVDRGVVKSYLHNTSTAKRYNVKTTGNAGLIVPEPHNVMLEPGNHSKDELIKNIKKGIYITNVWYTRFQNSQTGDFSTIPRDGAFYIENGKIKYPLKNLRVSENLLNVMKKVSALGKDAVQIKGWEVESPVSTPHVLVSNVNITKPL